ncbi:hemerythrin family protein [Spirulina sp. CS-785/01]|uniref:bacteriohemerythrin n=1 Tax=Spirulina sp. CS-785/01 TaxID=3021716 RepID=UPI002330D0C7|nr:hemerythrin family protein [Spirulina sp. CS-785/01]MDB9314857.1 hemerythrin family protein [Spirulina sp. CS-785/01]
MSYVWDDSLKTGIPLIDQQHKQLIDQMSLLVQALKSNQAQGEIINILDFLDQYVEQHFSYEEGCMLKYRCPAAANNKTAHQKFIKTLKEVRQEYFKTGVSLSLVLKVNKELLEWFIHHIKRIDMQLQPCVVEV